MTKAKTSAAKTAGKSKTGGANVTPTNARTPRPPVGTGPAPGVTAEQGIPPAGRIGKNTVSSRPVSPGSTNDGALGIAPGGPGKRVPARPRVQEPEGEDRDLGARIRVQATKVGFVDNARRREGDVFDVYEAEFSDRWMVRVNEATPTRTTGPKAALKKIHDEAISGKLAKTGVTEDELNPDPLNAR